MQEFFWNALWWIALYCELPLFVTLLPTYAVLRLIGLGLDAYGNWQCGRD